MLKEIRRRFSRTNPVETNTEVRGARQPNGTTGNLTTEMRPVSPRELLIHSVGASLRTQANYAATGRVIGWDVDFLLAEAERVENTARKTIDLFEKASTDPKVASFKETAKRRLHDLGYEDVAEEITYLDTLSPEERYAEFVRREPISPFSYLVNMVNTFSLALVDDGKTERTIPLSSPTLDASYEGSDTLAMRRATRNVYTLLGLDTNELKDIAPRIKTIKPGEEILQTHYMSDGGLVVTLAFNGASPRKTSSYEKNIPHLKVTVS